MAHSEEATNAPLTLVILETSVSQLSLAIGLRDWALAKASGLLHSIEVFKASAPVIQVGELASIILIVWVEVALFPHASVTVQVLEITLFPTQRLVGFKQTLLNLTLPFTLACFFEYTNQSPFIDPVNSSKLETKEDTPRILLEEVVSPFGIKFWLIPSWIKSLLFHFV